MGGQTSDQHWIVLTWQFVCNKRNNNDNNNNNNNNLEQSTTTIRERRQYETAGHKSVKSVGPLGQAARTAGAAVVESPRRAPKGGESPHGTGKRWGSSL